MIGAFKNAIRWGGVGGYEGQGDLFSIGALPGATGTRHEGGMRVNYDRTTNNLNALFAVLAASLPGDMPTGLSATGPGSLGRKVFYSSNPTFAPAYTNPLGDMTDYMKYDLESDSFVDPDSAAQWAGLMRDPYGNIMATPTGG